MTNLLYNSTIKKGKLEKYANNQIMNKSSFSSNRSPAVNKSISAKSVRVITDNGEMLGVLNIQKALQMAADQGLDLVEVSPKATPPVCKIIDYGKYKYKVQKKYTKYYYNSM